MRYRPTVEDLADDLQRAMAGTPRREDEKSATDVLWRIAFPLSRLVAADPDRYFPFFMQTMHLFYDLWLARKEAVRLAACEVFGLVESTANGRVWLAPGAYGGAPDAAPTNKP